MSEAEQIVKAKWPDAYVRGIISGGEYIFSERNGTLSGTFRSAREAWESAAKRIEVSNAK